MNVGPRRGRGEEEMGREEEKEGVMSEVNRVMMKVQGRQGGERTDLSPKHSKSSQVCLIVSFIIINFIVLQNPHDAVNVNFCFKVFFDFLRSPFH